MVDKKNLIKEFQSVLKKPIMIEGIDQYLSDWRGVFKGKVKFVVFPSTTEEVSKILRLANKYNIPIVPQGGNTGLCGGATPDNSGNSVLINFTKLNNIRNIDLLGNTVTVEAGCILENVLNVVQEKDRIFPINLAAKGSCTIGGNLATNAGGIGVLKYGNARDLCLGLEVVLADGSIINDIKTIKKDNTGYDLKNLFIGSEGSLGIITRAVLRLYPSPSNKIVTFFGVQNFNSVLQSYLEISRRFGQFLQAFELISGVGLQFLEETKIAQSATQRCKSEWYVLMELGFNNSSVQQDVYEALDDLNNKNIIIDVVIGDTEAKAKKLWKMREDIPEANRKIGAITSHDISLPLENMESFINKSLIEIKKINFSLRVNCFGHIGDGNLHFNVFPPQNEGNSRYNGIKSKLTKIINNNCKNLGGSFSAEHGVGRLKVKDLKQYCDPGKFNVMCQIKKAIDPFAILNPGVILRQDTQD